MNITNISPYGSQLTSETANQYHDSNNLRQVQLSHSSDEFSTKQVAYFLNPSLGCNLSQQNDILYQLVTKSGFTVIKGFKSFFNLIFRHILG